DFFKKDALEDALGKWSTAPSVGVGIFNQLAQTTDKYIESLTTLTAQLKSRGNLFIKEALDAKLDIYPYRGGFFVLIKSNDPVADYEKLAKLNIYVVPMEQGLRIALCSITTIEVKGLALKIKNAISK